MATGTCTITVHFGTGEPPFATKVEFVPPRHDHCVPEAINGAVHVPALPDAGADGS